MIHADKVRDAKEALADAVMAWLSTECMDLMVSEACCSGDDHSPDCPVSKALLKMTEVAAELRALNAATCETCGGTGQVRKVSAGFQWIGHETMEPCPAGCKEGAKP